MIDYLALFSTAHELHCICPYLDSKTASTIAPSTVHSKLDYCKLVNSLYYNLPVLDKPPLSCTVLHVLWLKLPNLLISHPSSDLCNGSRLSNELNINSPHLPTKFVQPTNTYTQSEKLFSLHEETALVRQQLYSTSFFANSGFSFLGVSTSQRTQFNLL